MAAGGCVGRKLQPVQSNSLAGSHDSQPLQDAVQHRDVQPGGHGLLRGAHSNCTRTGGAAGVFLGVYKGLCRVNGCVGLRRMGVVCHAHVLQVLLPW